MRQCVDGELAGCETCAGVLSIDYCKHCHQVTGCQVTDKETQITGKENCFACRWITPADRRSHE